MLKQITSTIYQIGSSIGTVPKTTRRRVKRVSKRYKRKISRRAYKKR